MPQIFIRLFLYDDGSLSTSLLCNGESIKLHKLLSGEMQDKKNLVRLQHVTFHVQENNKKFLQ